MMAPPPPPANDHDESPTEAIDFGKFRKALRLIHCIQKERGASCSHLASSGDVERTGKANHVFGEALWQARTASDAAVRLLKEAHKDDRLLVSVPSTLAKIRPLIARSELQGAHDTAADELLFHRIFVCFNSLVAAVTQVYVLDHVEKHKKAAKSSTKTAQSNSPHPPKSRHHRALSNDINRYISPSWTLSPPSVDTTSRKTYVEPPETLHDPPPAPYSPDRPRAVSFLQNPDENAKIVPQLMKLLGTFVQLKESTGIERAILSSLVVLKDRAADSRLVNDLILEVEQQRRLLAKLNSSSWHYNHSLIIELTSLSPALVAWQQQILTDGVSSLSIDRNDSWNVLTCYMDKLHSMELLLLEEIESESPTYDVSQAPTLTAPGIIDVLKPPVASTADSGSLLQMLAQIVSVEDNNPTAVVSRVQAMSADELKSKLLSAINVSSESPRHKSLLQARDSTDDLVQDVTSILAQKAKASSSSEWDIGIYEVKFKRRIGQGSSGTTYLGTWSGQSVAVKVASITEFGMEGWRTEVAALRKVHHPNVIRLLGSIHHPNPLTLCLVLEYCDSGDLETAFQFPTPKNFFFHVSKSIVDAMTYLHSRRIIHRDLKPSNVLIHGRISTGNFAAKVTDFGLAAVLQDTNEGSGPGTRNDSESSFPPGLETILDNSVLGPQRNLTGETGTYRWMAPEVMRHEPYSVLCDVYSFAVIVWQFLTREEPFENESDRDAAGHIAIEKTRPPFPEGTPIAIRDLVVACWSDRPADRWPFEKISKSLEEIQSSLSIADRTWIEDTNGHQVYSRNNVPTKEGTGGIPPRGVSPSKQDKKNKTPLSEKQPKKSSLLNSLFGGASNKAKGKQRKKQLMTD